MQSVPPALSGIADFVRRNRRLLFLGTLIALAFRLFFLFQFRLLTDDSFIYGDIAKTWLQHGIFGQSFDNGPGPTIIRMPGYPLFLVLTWTVAGLEHYNAALIVQVLVDVATCFVIADLARRIASERAPKIAFMLAGLCPFFANYAAVALTETWAIFFAALALDAAVAALDNPQGRSAWITCGVALACGILLRPDSGMLMAVVCAYTLLVARRERDFKMVYSAVLVGAIALAPLVPWTIRNWHVFHLFQPLTPVNANMPGEFVPHGFQRWVRTWIADYASVEDVWFKVGSSDVSIDVLPQRALEDDRQRQRTSEIFLAYAQNGYAVSPEIDSRFAELANERIKNNPLRYYVGLPLLRAADLWLRPRTEMLPIDPHWWSLSEDDPPQFRWSILLAVVNLFYVMAALVSLGRGNIRYAGLFVAFALIRTAFLAWMPNPEPRYVLECYPAVIAMAGAVFERKGKVLV